MFWSPSEPSLQSNPKVENVFSYALRVIQQRKLELRIGPHQSRENGNGCKVGPPALVFGLVPYQARSIPLLSSERYQVRLGDHALLAVVARQVFRLWL